MPGPKKITKELCSKVIEAFEAGESMRGAAKHAGVSLSTVHRLAHDDDSIGRSVREAYDRNKHRRRAKSKVARTVVHAEPEEVTVRREAHKPVAIIPELAADADKLGGPTLGEILDSAWETYRDKSQPDRLRVSCFEKLFAVKAAPLIAEINRLTNAQPVAQSGPERVRLVLPPKARIPVDT